MKHASFNFAWRRGIGPARYVELKDGRRLLDDGTVATDVERVLVQFGQAVEPYEPLDTETGLFLNFAAVGPTEEAIRAFAHDYGLLGITGGFLPADFNGTPPKAAAFPDVGGFYGESLADWQTAIKDLHHAVDRWRSGKVDSRLARVVTGHLVSVTPVLSIRDGGPAIETQPDSLLSAMWLQFADAIASSTPDDFRACEVCGKWFHAPAETNTLSKFCSTPCRLKAYRGRQKEARRLHAEGKTPGQIAKLLDSDTSTVRGWLTKEKR